MYTGVLMDIKNNIPFIKDNSTGILYKFEQRIVTVGSSEDCIIRLKPSYPAYICHFLFIGGSYNIQVLTKDIRCLVNGEVIHGPHRLEKNDLIEIGEESFVYHGSENIDNTENGNSGHIDSLIEIVMLLLRSRTVDITSDILAAISKLFRSDAARIVSEEAETGKRATLARYPVHAGLDRFSNRAIDWAKNASHTVLMLESDWQDSGNSNMSLEKNAVASILCAPLTNAPGFKGFLYLDRIKKDDKFTETDKLLCDKLIPLFNELLVNSEEKRRQADVIAKLQEQNETSAGGIIYRSERMRSVISLADKIAPTDMPVLLLGETGTGKELMAKHVHAMSLRSGRPFKAINCGALPENLIESELFGHEKGAFTGAHAKKNGLFEAAEGGTVFLDEIGEMPVALQVKLLRILQESEITRLGATEPVKVNVRIIAATNRNLVDEIEKGNFRQDLFFRLNALSIIMPPLRERSEDIIYLSEFFVNKYCIRMGTERKTLSSEASLLLSSYLWPGNVRELENIIQKAVVLSSSNRIGAKDIELENPGINGNARGETTNIPTLQAARREAEKEVICSALCASVGNVSQAARIIDIDRKWLITKMSEYGIDAGIYRK
jgi:transcriptional regulator with GAF, ATPase, and Fis domain